MRCLQIQCLGLPRIYGGISNLYTNPHQVGARLYRVVNVITCIAPSLSGCIMLGLTFWKYALGEKIDETRRGGLNARLGRQRKLKIFVLIGAAIAAAAIVIGLPVVGLSVYLLTTLPFILFAS